MEGFFFPLDSYHFPFSAIQSFKKINSPFLQAYIDPQIYPFLVELGVLKESFWNRQLPLHKRGEALFLEIPSSPQGVLKVYRRGGLLGKYLDRTSLDPSRALRELSFYSFLAQENFNTPKPYGSFTFQKGKFFYVHFLITKTMKNTLDLPSYYQKFPEQFLLEKKIILQNVAKMVRKLHDLGVYHGDLNLKNILLSPLSKEVAFIDFDQSKYENSLSINQRWDNIFRLYRSALKLFTQGKFLGLTNQDLYRFAFTYWGKELDLKSAKNRLRKKLFHFRFRRFFW